jgi:Mg-chelatase subunit ChlD
MKRKLIGMICSFGLAVAAALNAGFVNAEGNPVDVVIMIDQSGSISDSPDEHPSRVNDLELQKNAAKTFLDSFASATPRPRVAIGTFNQKDKFNPAGAARILAGGELTKDYAALKALIDTVQKTEGYTDLASALEVGVSQLLGDSTPLVNERKFLIAISDGIPNRPGLGAYENCNICGCDNAYEAAEMVVKQARKKGVEVITVQYDGHGSETKCEGEPATGMNFLMNNIAYLPGHFYMGSNQLGEAFERVQCQISCDDNNPCTVDTCSDVPGKCSHTPINLDRDSDGINDCQDSCFGNNALIGTACTQTIGTCSEQGSYVCNELGAVDCSVEDSMLPLASLECIGCESSVAINSSVETGADYTAELLDVIRRAGRKIARSGAGADALAKFKAINTRASAIGAQATSFFSSLGARIDGKGVTITSTSCINKLKGLNCTTLFSDAEASLALRNLSDLVREARKSIRLARNTTEAGAARLRIRVRAVRQNLAGFESSIPSTYSICQ